MSNATDAWMPFYVGDYLGDTQRLTTEQHGAYLLLILDYWRNGPPPDDDAVLRQIARLDDKAWKKHRPALLRLFRVTDGEWRHKRIDLELDEAKANADRRSSKARAAAEARWSNAKDDAEASPVDAPSNARRNARSNARSTAQADANAMPQAMLGECPPPSPKEEERNIPPTQETARERKRDGLSPKYRAVMDAAGFTAPPADFALVAEWERGGADFEGDILPVLRKLSADARQRGGRMPFKLKYFEPHVLAKVEADNDEMDRWRRSAEQARRLDEDQARAAR